MENTALLPNSRESDDAHPVRIFSQEPDMNESLTALLTTHLYFNITIAVFLPLGILSELLNWGDSPTFLLNMVAIVGLAKVRVE